MRHQLVFLTIEPHIVRLLTPLKSGKSTLVCHLIILLLGLSWFISWKLSQKFSRTWHIRIFFKIFGRDEQAAQCLKHYDTLLHVFLFSLFEHTRQKPVQKTDGMIGWLLYIEAQGFRDLSKPINDKISNFLILTADFYLKYCVLWFLLALGIHWPEDVRNIKLVLLSMALHSPNCVRATLWKVRTTHVTVYQVSVSDQCFTRLDMLVVVASQFALVVAALIRRLLIGHDVYVSIWVQGLTRQSRPVVGKVASLWVWDLHTRCIIVQRLHRNHLATILVLWCCSRNQIRKTEMLIATLIAVRVCVRSS